MLLTILWLYLPLHHAYSPFTNEALEVIYGNYSIEDLFLPLDNKTSAEKETEEQDELPSTTHFLIDDDDLKILEDVSINATARDHDLMEFNEISRQVANITRKANSWSSFYGHDDPEDWYHYHERIEPKKKMMLIKINIQFLMHTRYKVYKALTARWRYRGDKRYRLGYLFNRMRRLNTEMRKVVSVASLQNSTNNYRSLASLMRLYEQVVRYDVDLRDTASLVKQVNAEEARYDYYTLTEPKKLKSPK